MHLKSRLSRIFMFDTFNFWKVRVGLSFRFRLCEFGFKLTFIYVELHLPLNCLVTFGCKLVFTTLKNLVLQNFTTFYPLIQMISECVEQHRSITNSCGTLLVPCGNRQFIPSFWFLFTLVKESMLKQSPNWALSSLKSSVDGPQQMQLLQSCQLLPGCSHPI